MNGFLEAVGYTHTHHGHDIWFSYKVGRKETSHFRRALKAGSLGFHWALLPPHVHNPSSSLWPFPLPTVLISLSLFSP